jgi:hypothetical protein
VSRLYARGEDQMLNNLKREGGNGQKEGGGRRVRQTKGGEGDSVTA